MATVQSPPRVIDTLADLLERLGDLAPQRVLFLPAPGTATEEDLIAVNTRKERLCELIDGVLVEKAVGYRESILATFMATLLNQFVLPRNLGLVTGADWMMRLFPGLVRVPDVAFAAWDRLPDRRVPKEPIPDLAIEILSRSNTKKEMELKRRNYFESGSRLVWIIDPADRTARVYTAIDQSISLDESGTLDGGDVLPGFSLSLRDLFAMLDRHAD